MSNNVVSSSASNLRWGLFDHLLLITLSPSPSPSPSPSASSPGLIAQVKETIHPSSSTSTSSSSSPSSEAIQAAVSKSASLFCFPDLAQILTSKDRLGISIGDCYVFVLTDSEGIRQYGFCRRMMMRDPSAPSSSNDLQALGATTAMTPKPKTLPCCLCLITHHPWFQLFTRILAVLEERIFVCVSSRAVSLSSSNLLDSTVGDFLQALMQQPIPLPGKSFNSLPLTAALSLRTQSLSLLRPNDLTDPPLVDLTFRTMLDSLSSNNIFFVFIALLCERRVIFSSSSLGRLSSCCHASLSMLYPFSWQHIFIPILPHSLINYCCAPMPFIIGVHSSMVKEVQSMPLEKIVFVDLDNNFVDASVEDVMLVPDKPLNTLKHSIDHAVASLAKTGSCDDRSIAFAFINFFLAFFANYRKFFKVDPKNSERILFDRETFVSSQMKENILFVEAFCSQQMFDVWIREREDKIPLTGPFETECAKSPIDSLSALSNLSSMKSALASTADSFLSTFSSAFSSSPSPSSTSSTTTSSSSSSSFAPSTSPSSSNISTSPSSGGGYLNRSPTRRQERTPPGPATPNPIPVHLATSKILSASSPSSPRSSSPRIQPLSSSTSNHSSSSSSTSSFKSQGPSSSSTPTRPVPTSSNTQPPRAKTSSSSSSSSTPLSASRSSINGSRGRERVEEPTTESIIALRPPPSKKNTSSSNSLVGDLLFTDFSSPSHPPPAPSSSSASSIAHISSDIAAHSALTSSAVDFFSPRSLSSPSPVPLHSSSTLTPTSSSLLVTTRRSSSQDLLDFLSSPPASSPFSGSTSALPSTSASIRQVGTLPPTQGSDFLALMSLPSSPSPAPSSASSAPSPLRFSSSPLVSGPVPALFPSSSSSVFPIQSSFTLLSPSSPSFGGLYQTTPLTPTSSSSSSSAAKTQTSLDSFLGK